MTGETMTRIGQCCCISSLWDAEKKDGLSDEHTQSMCVRNFILRLLARLSPQTLNDLKGNQFPSQICVRCKRWREEMLNDRDSTRNLLKSGSVEEGRRQRGCHGVEQAQGRAGWNQRGGMEGRAGWNQRGGMEGRVEQARGGSKGWDEAHFFKISAKRRLGAREGNTGTTYLQF